MALNIGAVIVAKRKEKSRTQEQLAKAVGISAPAVSKWETGTSYPDITLLSPIARALNITVDELLSYQIELCADDVNELAKKAVRTYETEGLVGFYTMLDEPDRAEELLDSLPKAKVDPDFLYPSIYALRGENATAMRLIQENIKSYLPKISQSLSFLCAFAREKNDLETACALADINMKMTELFDLRKEIAYPDMVKVLVRQGHREEALNYLEAYVQTILDWGHDHSENPVFNHLEAESSDPDFIKKVLAQSLFMDHEFEPLTSEPRYGRILDKLREITETPR